MLRVVVHHLRLTCSEFFVDMRIGMVGGKWLASCDTPDGPSLGWGEEPINAAIMALRPFDGKIEELLHGVERQGGR